METATSELVLYDANEKLIIAEVFPGNKYKIPTNISIYIGDLESFKTEYPDYKHLENLNQ